jgi:hypothetical protein
VYYHTKVAISLVHVWEVRSGCNAVERIFSHIPALDYDISGDKMAKDQSRCKSRAVVCLNERRLFRQKQKKKKEYNDATRELGAFSVEVIFGNNMKLRSFQDHRVGPFPQF